MRRYSKRQKAWPEGLSVGQVIISFNGSVLWAVQRLCQSACWAVGVYAAASLSASTGCPVALSTFLDAWGTRLIM